MVCPRFDVETRPLDIHGLMGESVREQEFGKKNKFFPESAFGPVSTSRSNAIARIFETVATLQGCFRVSLGREAANRAGNPLDDPNVVSVQRMARSWPDCVHRL
jgi:hypothetical protein